VGVFCFVALERPMQSILKIELNIFLKRTFALAVCFELCLHPMKKFFRHFLALVILLHCVGVMQLVSTYSKDTSVWIGMLSMNEEETKKEKESKEDVDYSKDIYPKNITVISPLAFTGKYIYFCCSKNRVNHQFIIELPTPPPDSLV
jgi:hypothetical protein